jgi:hypothetical protein
VPHSRPAAASAANAVRRSRFMAPWCRRLGPEFVDHGFMRNNQS